MGGMDLSKIKTTILDSLLNYIERYYYIFLALIFSLAVYNVFYCLGDTPIYSWDEARHGVSAYEMLKRGELIVNTYGYQNDYWNLKPPLSFWAIMMGYKIAGFNPLGLRLYSAAAALLTILAVSLFVKYKHNGIASLISALVLVTTPQYIVIHCARTGDADSLFVLFFTLSMISMLLIEKNIKWLYIAGIAFSFAFLTKGWHAFNIALIGFLYLLFTKRIFKLKIKEWVLFTISSLSLIGIWATLRAMKDGLSFFRMMINYDLLARTSRPLEGHIGNYSYYINIFKEKYLFWMILLGVSFVAYLVLYSNTLHADKLDKKRKNHIIGMVLWSIVPLLAYTYAKTKITWYIQPVYPVFAIYIGVLSSSIITGLKRNLIVQVAFIVFIVAAVNKHESVIYKHIVLFKNDNARVTFQNFDGFKRVQGAKAYIISGPSQSEQLYWKQSDLLSAELYGDLIPMNGGLRAFLVDKDEDSVLIIPKEENYSSIINKYNLKISSESESVYILRK
jgi:4-amino-4-deoxy-L-arabinose transferase-like glycosyltransferase